MAKFKRNKFMGADDIYLTKKNIAVRRISVYLTKDGSLRQSDKTRYYKKTSSNLRKARDIYGFIRKGR